MKAKAVITGTYCIDNIGQVVVRDFRINGVSVGESSSETFILRLLQDSPDGGEPVDLLQQPIKTVTTQEAID